MEKKSKIIYNKYVSCLLEFPLDCPDPLRCPKCGGHLNKKHLQKSSFAEYVVNAFFDPDCSYIAYDYTYLMVCQQCQWWYIREAFGRDRKHASDVYITYAVADCDGQEQYCKATPCENGYPTPWKQALTDGQLYNKIEKYLDNDLRNLFYMAILEAPLTQSNVQERLSNPQFTRILYNN